MTDVVNLPTPVTAQFALAMAIETYKNYDGTPKGTSVTALADVYYTWLKAKPTT